MFWIEMYGPKPDGKHTTDAIGAPFLTIEDAIAKARKLGKTNRFPWGRAVGFRVRDERKAIVREGIL
jgi:hypothetical protein